MEQKPLLAAAGKPMGYSKRHARKVVLALALGVSALCGVGGFVASGQLRSDHDAARQWVHDSAITLQVAQAEGRYPKGYTMSRDISGSLSDLYVHKDMEALNAGGGFGAAAVVRADGYSYRYDSATGKFTAGCNSFLCDLFR